MWSKFCKFMPLLEKDKDDYILGKVQFQQEIENRHLNGFKSHKDQPDKARMLCKHYGKDGHGCYLTLFEEYNYAYLYCAFESYPTSIKEETAKKSTSGGIILHFTIIPGR